MNTQEIQAYNTRHNLTGKDDELVEAINLQSGKREVITVKLLNKLKGWRRFDPAAPVKEIDNKLLSDNVLEMEKQLAAKEAEIAALKAQLKGPEEEVEEIEEVLEQEEPEASAAPEAPKKRGRPKKQPE
jgi:hypothetical protein